MATIIIYMYVATYFFYSFKSAFPDPYLLHKDNFEWLTTMSIQGHYDSFYFA